MNVESPPGQSLRRALKRTLRSSMLVIGTATLLFVFGNIGAYLLLIRFAEPNASNVFCHVVSPDSPEGVAVLKRVFNVNTPEQALNRLKSAPGFEMHPNLHYMTARTDNPCYRIGLEGIRYDAGWDDETVSTLLNGRRDLIFLMGGSTLLGHGVAANETISWYLNRRWAGDGTTVALNFGAQAYDQQREIEKLSYLLRAGYRPKRVVFLDGWNDIAGIARSNMRWQDKVIFHGFAVNRGELAFTPGGKIGVANYARLFLESLPITRLAEAKRRNSLSVDSVEVARDPFTEGFDFREADWMFFNWETYAARNKALLKVQMLDYYRKNLVFLQGLARAFRFELTVFFQPMGFFYDKSPFVPAAAREESGYHLLFDLRQEVRKEIARGALPMIDASDALDAMNNDRYVDTAHYSPSANAELARLIYDEIGRSHHSRQTKIGGPGPLGLQRLDSALRGGAAGSTMGRRFGRRVADSEHP